jgi:hypothetical protein
MKKPTKKSLKAKLTRLKKKFDNIADEYHFRDCECLEYDLYEVYKKIEAVENELGKFLT